MKRNVNLYVIEDDFGIEQVMARSVDEALVAFRKHRNENEGETNPNIRQIATKVTGIIIANELAESMNIEQVAEYLGITTSRIRQMARSGELPGRHVGKRAWLFDRDVVEVFATKPRPVGRPSSLPTR